jgi:hypothetical protein
MLLGSFLGTGDLLVSRLLLLDFPAAAGICVLDDFPHGHRENLVALTD